MGLGVGIVGLPNVQVNQQTFKCFNKSSKCGGTELSILYYWTK